MGMNRVCPICYQQEAFSFNFGPNSVANAEFHQKKWCKCGYTSGEELMKDQDLGFTDNRWVGVAKSFLIDFFEKASSGGILSKDQMVRLFLKQLKNSANNYDLSIELVPIKEGEEWNFIEDGNPIHRPRKDVFNNAIDLETLPDKIILNEMKQNILNDYKKSKNNLEDLEKINIKKNRIIAFLVLMCIILFILLIV